MEINDFPIQAGPYAVWSAKTKTKTGCFSFSFSRNGPYGTKTGADEFAAAEKWSRQLEKELEF